MGKVWGMRGPTNLREETTMAMSARPAAAVTPMATAVFQRSPPARGPPRRPVATRSTQPHAHIGCRCLPDRYIFSVKKEKESQVPEIEPVLEQQRAFWRSVGASGRREEGNIFPKEAFFRFFLGFDLGSFVADAV